MFVESDERAEGRSVAIVEKNRRRRAIARKAARRVGPVSTHIPASHQRGALCKAVRKQGLVMRGVEFVARRDAGDEIDGDHMRALME